MYNKILIEKEYVVELQEIAGKDCKLKAVAELQRRMHDAPISLSLGLARDLVYSVLDGNNGIEIFTQAEIDAAADRGKREGRTEGYGDGFETGSVTGTEVGFVRGRKDMATAMLAFLVERGEQITANEMVEFIVDYLTDD